MQQRPPKDIVTVLFTESCLFSIYDIIENNRDASYSLDSKDGL